jgi:tyrosyl-tRNA synthetase
MAIKINDIIAHFDRTADQFLSREEFKAKLRSGKPLRVKYGLDIRTPVLHLGHAVNLWLLRYLQDLGHKVVLVFGDFTTRIGDLDGRLETLADIPEEQIRNNIQELIEQAKMVLRFDDPALIEVRRNSEWYSSMSVHDLMDIFSIVTHAKLMSRDMFQMRLAEGREIYVHEMLFPIFQGYDSVMVDSDLAVIGSDQLFNESMGRQLQEKHKKRPQTLVTTKITPGTDGRHKQSKAAGNYIGLAHSPRDKFGRVMSIPDTLIDEYFRLYTAVPLKEIDAMKGLIESKPRDAKLALAKAIVERYHGAEVAAEEGAWFENTISKGNIPEDLPKLAVVSARMEALDLVALARPGKSKGDTRRLIRQGAVELDGRKISNPDEELPLKTGDILKVGKRNWFLIEVVKLNDLETEALLLKPMMVDDIDLISRYFPEGDMAQYLGKLGGGKKIRATTIREVFKKVILQPEPRNEWLWKITLKGDPDTVIGVAHLSRDLRHGNQNIWVVPGRADEEEIMRECLTVINSYAFDVLGFSAVEFKEAFATATAPPNLTALHNSLIKMRAEQLNKDTPEGTWGFTKEGWQMMQDWRRTTAPALFKSAAAKKPSSRKRKEPPAPPLPPKPGGGGTT